MRSTARIPRTGVFVTVFMQVTGAEPFTCRCEDLFEVGSLRCEAADQVDARSAFLGGGNHAFRTVSTTVGHRAWRQSALATLAG